MLQENTHDALSHTWSRLQRIRHLLRERVVHYRRGLVMAGAGGLGLIPVLLFATPDAVPSDRAGMAAPDTVVAVEQGQPASLRPHQPGVASYYHSSLAGNPTASGEPYDPDRLTAAHRTLPLGTRVRVTNVRNGKSVVVRVNDRGPFVGKRIIDLSHAAARKIGMIHSGLASVRVEGLPPASAQRAL